MNDKQIYNSLSGWQSKLLDLGRQNPFINFRVIKQSNVELVHPSIEQFFSVTDMKLKFYNLDNLNLNNEEIYDKKTITNALQDNQAFQKNKNSFVVATQSNYYLKQALSRLIKKQATYKEENAIDVLYLTVGQLNWYEDKQDDINSSPLLLMPVTINYNNGDNSYYLTINEGDLLINETLIEKLKNDFKLDFSYQFDSLNDLKTNYYAYKEYIQKLISHLSWTVSDNIYISIFAFTKINMYNDLELNKDKIIKHPIIRALAGDYSGITINESLNNDQIDNLIDPAQSYQVLDCDSTQYQAIIKAVNGESFVLQGPPGTGKSQTITNIIAELIARGKKVLFVAEKQAALNVVYNNLKKANLDGFALSLHHSKIDRKELINTLYNNLETRQKLISIDANLLSQTSLEYNYAKTQLNRYKRSLMRTREPLGLNVFELYDKYLEYQDAKDVVVNLDIKPFTQKYLTEVIHLLTNYQTKDNSNTNQSLFSGLKKVSYTKFFEEEFIGNLSEGVALITELFDLIKRIDILKLNKKSNLETINQIIKLYGQLPLTINENYLSDQTLGKQIKLYQKHHQEITSNYQTINQLNQKYQVDIINLDLEQILNTFLNTNSVNRLFSKQYKQAKEQIISYQVISNTKHEDLISDLKELIVIKNNCQEVNKILDKISFLDGIDPNDYDQEYQNAIIGYDICQLLSDNGIEQVSDYKQLINLKMAKTKFNKELKHLEKLNSHLTIALEKIDNYFDSKHKVSTKPLEAILLKFNLMTINFNDLISYLSNKDLDSQIEKYQLKEFIAKASKIDNINLKESFLKRLYFLMINHTYSYDATLKKFNRLDYDNYKLEFIKADKQLLNIAKHQIKTLVTQHTPSLSGLQAHSGEVVMLRKEYNKTRKHLPVRLLFSYMPKLITTLKPVIMMSPLAVSSILKNEDYSFDTVIFDEASQIRLEAAVGSIYRAKQVIIVGDREQLPPTDFFQTSEVNEDLEVDYDAFDSILDLAGAILPPVFLRWHYRSQYESLIHISNQYIYDGKLTTFPAVTKESVDTGLKYHYVKGIFNRSNTYNSGVNEIEVNKVVELVFDHFDKFNDSRSLGVVTFNSQQQQAIEAKILERISIDKKYDSFFDNNKEEPFFIKNIETVQGDERDVIILSTCYGFDANNRLTMNFGPLNKDGGYRRLNVATTRAKLEMIVVTSLLASDINLDKSNAKGVRILKEFLEYAETISSSDTFSSKKAKSMMAIDVSNEINKLGFKVVYQVGDSNSKIDLAVIDPNLNDKYLLGIELDGSIYQSGNLTRDVERLRTEVLNKRGWQIYRIWSTDWFNKKKHEIAKLKEILNTDQIIKKKVKEEIIVVEQKEEEIKDDEQMFADYPLYEKLYQTLKDRNSEEILNEMISCLAPLHIEELDRFLTVIYPDNDSLKQFKKDIDNILSYGLITFRNDYYLNTKRKITFRKAEDSSNRRLIHHIHPNELQDAVIKILLVTNSMVKGDLINMVLSLCGYVKSNDLMQQRINRVVEMLQLKGKVKLEDSLVILIEE